MHLIRLALAIAHRWSRKYPGHDCDDMTSVALIELVASVQRYLAKPDEDRVCNISKFVACNINYKLRQHVRTDHLITIPYGSIHYQIKRGMYDALNISVETGLSSDRSTEDILIGTLVKRMTGASKLWAYTTPETDVREVMDKVLKTDEDKRIVELRLSGWVDKEIAADIGVSVSYVQKKRHELISSLKRELSIFVD